MNARIEMYPERGTRAAVQLLRRMGSGVSELPRRPLPRFEVMRRADRFDEDFVVYLIHGNHRAELGSFKHAEAVGLSDQITAAGMKVEWIEE